MLKFSMRESMFDGSKDTEICALTETTFELETCAIHLFGGVLERLWNPKFDIQDSFGLGQFHSIHAHDTHFSCHIRVEVRRYDELN